MPSSRRRSASHGPLRSLTRPVSTSVPVTTMPARALMPQVGRSSGGQLDAAGRGDRDSRPGSLRAGTSRRLAVDAHLRVAVAEGHDEALGAEGLGRAAPAAGSRRGSAGRRSRSRRQTYTGPVGITCRRTTFATGFCAGVCDPELLEPELVVVCRLRGRRRLRRAVGADRRPSRRTRAGQSATSRPTIARPTSRPRRRPGRARPRRARGGARAGASGGSSAVLLGS